MDKCPERALREHTNDSDTTSIHSIERVTHLVCRGDRNTKLAAETSVSSVLCHHTEQRESVSDPRSRHGQPVPE